MVSVCLPCLLPTARSGLPARPAACPVLHATHYYALDSSACVVGLYCLPFCLQLLLLPVPAPKPFACACHPACLDLPGGGLLPLPFFPVTCPPFCACLVCVCRPSPKTFPHCAPAQFVLPGCEQFPFPLMSLPFPSFSCFYALFCLTTLFSATYHTTTYPLPPPFCAFLGAHSSPLVSPVHYATTPHTATYPSLQFYCQNRFGLNHTWFLLLAGHFLPACSFFCGWFLYRSCPSCNVLLPRLPTPYNRATVPTPSFPSHQLFYVYHWCVLLTYCWITYCTLTTCRAWINLARSLLACQVSVINYFPSHIPSTLYRQVDFGFLYLYRQVLGLLLMHPTHSHHPTYLEHLL